MSYNRFWVLWLAEHAPKSTQYQFNKFDCLTPKKIRERAKIILRLLFLTRKQIFRKANKEHYIREKNCKNEHAQKAPKYQIIKLGRLTARSLSEVAKVILKLHFLSRMQVLRKNKESYQTRKNCKNIFYLFLGALLCRASSKTS